MCSFKKYGQLMLGLMLVLLQGSAWAGGYVDVLDLPAKPSSLAVRSPLLDVAAAGEHLVAVGQRGHILYSDDGGKIWKQANVPVSSDLTAVHFATRTQGWAVGHDSVVLHSSDGGNSWTKQLDGRQLGRLMLDFYAKRPDAERWLEEAARIEREGADKPFLDVWFEDERNGFIVGAFNLIFRTRDGGQSWEPWADRTDNPSAYHLNAIGSDGHDLFIAGEQGLLLRLNRQTERFEALASPYEGSFFGMTGQPGAVLVYGLRGHVFRSTDSGASWVQIPTGLPVSFTAAARDTSGHLYLFSQAGHTLRSGDGGATFVPVEIGPLAPVSGAVVQAETGLVLVGSRGLSERTLVPAQQE